MIRNKEKMVLAVKMERERANSRIFGLNYLIFGILNEKIIQSALMFSETPYCMLVLRRYRISSHPRLSLFKFIFSTTQVMGIMEPFIWSVYFKQVGVEDDIHL